MLRAHILHEMGEIYFYAGNAVVVAVVVACGLLRLRLIFRHSPVSKFISIKINSYIVLPVASVTCSWFMTI